jgi:hypothetical protein
MAAASARAMIIKKDLLFVFIAVFTWIPIAAC